MTLRIITILIMTVFIFGAITGKARTSSSKNALLKKNFSTKKIEQPVSQVNDKSWKAYDINKPRVLYYFAFLSDAQSWCTNNVKKGNCIVEPNETTDIAKTKNPFHARTQRFH
jgi:hypothetical protein